METMPFALCPAIAYFCLQRHMGDLEALSEHCFCRSSHPLWLGAIGQKKVSRERWHVARQRPYVQVHRCRACLVEGSRADGDFPNPGGCRRGYILYEGYKRLIEPPQIQSLPMLAIACAGLVVNLIAMRMLEGGKARSLNIKGAYLEVWSDMLSSVGVIGAAAVI